MKTTHLLAIACLISLLFACEKQGAVMDPQHLIPTPKELTTQSGSFHLKSSTAISYGAPELADVANYAQEAIQWMSGMQLPVESRMKDGNMILLRLDPSLGENDCYKLIINDKKVEITGANPRSVILGIQTILQLLPVEPSSSIHLQALEITDFPSMEWRGLMLDVARHFYDKDEIKRFIDRMALYKFNKFHWHLTDDQGWRVEIKQYPLLTEKSGFRTFNRHDRVCMNFAEAEDNPDYLLPKDKLRQVGDSVEYGGFYTQDEIREVVAYAAARGIDVIPELDMPGHMQAGIAAYPEISCFNEATWGKNFSSPICPGKDHTLEFCKNVYKEIFDLFPYEYVHLGADEVEKINWEKCPNCQKRMRQEKLKDEKELQSWFVRQMEDFFIENGKKLIGWDEIIDGGLSESATVMWWRNWSRNAGAHAAEQGNELILAPNSHYYFDFKQDPNTLKRLYEYDPLTMGLTAEQAKFVKGIQANTWCEYIPSEERMEFKIYPRALALSEVAWNKEGRPDWETFFQKLPVQFARMDALGINYRPLDIENFNLTNAFVGETMVTWNQPLSNIEIRYTTDGSFPTKESALYTEPMKITESVDYQLRMFRPDGTFGEIFKTSYRKEEYRVSVTPENATPGLNLNWHELIARKVADIETVPVQENFKVNGITIPKGINGKRGLIYTGFLKVEKDDVYTFVLGSDDGSALYIQDELVVDNDGPHGPLTINGQIALGVGYHPLKLLYFDMNNGGFVSLKVFDSEGNEIELNEHTLSH